MFIPAVATIRLMSQSCVAMTSAVGPALLGEKNGSFSLRTLTAPPGDPELTPMVVVSTGYALVLEWIARGSDLHVVGMV